jgi:phage-related holin
MRLNSSNAVEQRDQKRFFRFGSYSLRVKLLIALIIFSAVSTILMAWASVVNAREALKNQASESLLNASTQTAHSVDDFFNNTINAFETDIQLPVFREYFS